MPLDRRMRALLSHPCPHCGNKRTMKGSWFAFKANYACSGCHRAVTMTYDAKIALFAKHAHLVRFK
jgi:DNA-directed RNA polymerase subunit RPC12/RpoP